MNHITTLVFEDHGQDFLEWDIDDRGLVVACRPFQAWMWVGVTVLNPTVEVGELVRYERTHPFDLEAPHGVLNIKYPIEDICHREART